MKWLKFSDGYAAGLRRSVNMMIVKLIGLKSHDYNVNAPMMQYNMDEEPPCSGISIFALRGTTVAPFLH
jgi:hypothetical protein